MATKFYHCNICGNVMAAVVPSGIIPFCCDCKMEELVYHTTDTGHEAHVPVVERVNDMTLKIKVGETPHHATKEHHICFIVVETCHGAIMRHLDKCSAPEITVLCKEDPVAVYAYCNLHGLWRCQCKAEK